MHTGFTIGGCCKTGLTRQGVVVRQNPCLVQRQGLSGKKKLAETQAHNATTCIFGPISPSLPHRNPKNVHRCGVWTAPNVLQQGGGAVGLILCGRTSSGVAVSLGPVSGRAGPGPLSRGVGGSRPTRSDLVAPLCAPPTPTPWSWRVATRTALFPVRLVVPLSYGRGCGPGPPALLLCTRPESLAGL